MKKSIKYILIILLLFLSFYYTKYITNIIIDKTELMSIIKNESKKYNVDYINGTIDNDYIIPGKKGKKVNQIDSYYVMKEVGYYDSNLLIYDDILPVISISNIKDKIIKKGNHIKKGVSILVNESIYINYCQDSNINCTNIKEISNEYCLVNDNNCNDKQKIEPTYTFYNENIINLNITSGDIILIDNNVNLDIFKYLIKTIKYHNLEILSLSDLISE